MPALHRYANIIRVFIAATFVLVPVVAFAGLFVFQTGTVARERATVEAERLARSIAAQQDQQIRNIRNLLIGVSQFAELKNRDAAGCNTTLNLLLDHANFPTPYYLNLGVADITGDTFCTAAPSERIVNIADRYYFRRAVQTRTFSIGEYQLGRITGQKSINFGYPILDEVGGVQFVVFAAVSLDALHENANRVRETGYPNLIILDRSGTFIVSAEHPDEVGTTFSYHENIHRNAEGSFLGIGMDGVEYVFGYSTLPNSAQEEHLHFVVGIALSQIYSYAEETTARYAEYFFGAIAFSAAAGWFVSGRLVRRLLSHVANG